MSDILSESNFTTEVLSEMDTETGSKNWFIEGVFMEADVVNRNRRIYPGHIMEKEVNRYISEYVQTNRAIGELNHPPTAEVNPERASHLITEIKKNGNQYIGKAKILDTPCGNVARGLLEGGVKLGVSSRALGSVKKNMQGVNEVQENFSLRTVDIVYQPSAPNAFVDGLMEGEEFIWNTTEEDKEFLEGIQESIHDANKAQLQEAKVRAFEMFINRIANK